MTPRLYAWAHAVTPAEAVAFAARFPGLGLVLNGGNHAAAPDLATPPIAYVGNEAQARAVAAGGPWAAAIILDERNQTGPSGSYLAPWEYATAFEPIAAPLRAAGIPVHTMGLAPIFPTWWSRVAWAGAFDRTYHGNLPPADGRAWNPNKTRLAHITSVLDQHPGPWILSPAPFRGWLERLMQPVSVRQWAALSTRQDVLGVAMWCLQETKWGDGTWQSEHGLLDRHGRMTTVGREVLTALG